MIVKYKDTRVNLDNVSHWGAGPNWAVSSGEIVFFAPESFDAATGLFDKPVIMLYLDTPEMAERSIAMIDRHISRGRSMCDLGLLGKYDELGAIVFVTEMIRRTVNRIAGRWGL